MKNPVTAAILFVVLPLAGCSTQPEDDLCKNLTYTQCKQLMDRIAYEEVECKSSFDEFAAHIDGKKCKNNAPVRILCEKNGETFGSTVNGCELSGEVVKR